MIYKYYTADVIDLDSNGTVVGNVIVKVFIWRSAFFAQDKVRNAINKGCNGRNLMFIQLRRVS